MRLVILFIFALAFGAAHADDSGQWQETIVQEQQQTPEEYNEVYLDDDFGGDQTIIQQQQNVTIIDNSVTINITNFNFIEEQNNYPDAPGVVVWGPQPPPVRYCYPVFTYWGWVIYAYTFQNTSVPLAQGNNPWQYHQARVGLWQQGQCPNFSY
jgi:hypothetical protein